MMTEPDVHRRRSIRLRDYDYSQQGAYFVTVCAWNRECLFGEIKNGQMGLNEYGEMVMKCWKAIPDHFPHVATDEFIIMPNHIHGIVFIVGARHAVPLQTIGKQFAKPVSGSLSTIIRSFKSAVTKSINTIRTLPACPCGSGIITNTSLEMKMISQGYVNTLQITPRNGARMKTTL